MALTPAVQTEFFTEIITTLGGTLVDVELSDSDLLVCFKKAVRTYQQKGHNALRREFMALPVVDGTLTYTVPDGIDTIVRVIQPTNSLATNDPFSQAAYGDMLWGSSGNAGGGSCGCSSHGGFDFLTYELALGYIERLQRMTAYELQFQYDRFRKTITFFKNPGREVTWMLDLYRNLDDDEYTQIDWIVRWTVAEAKGLLGIAYRKFQSLAAPTGETNLSGSDYIQESNQEKEQLLEDILNYSDGEIDFMEIRVG